MKKVISVVLALLMMFPMAAMLIPTVSASTVEPVNEPDTWVYYEQNFDDASLAGKTDVELAQAIGWTEPNATNTMLIQNGQLRFVQQYRPDGLKEGYTGNNWASYTTTLVQDDKRMANSITTLEYTITYQRRARGDENDFTVGNKTISADGQGIYQFAGTALYGRMNGANNGYILARVNMSGAHQLSHNIDYTPAGGARIWGNTVLEQVAPLPTTTQTTGIEFNDAQVGDSNIGKYTSTAMGLTMRVKQVVNPASGAIELYVNDILVARTLENTKAIVSAMLQSSDAGLAQFWVKSGIDVLIDNIKISGKEIVDPQYPDLAPGVNGGKVYYEENFDDVDPTLVDKDLAAALGWSAPAADATLWIEDGAVRIATQYTKTNAQEFVNENGKFEWGSGYGTRWVKDYDLTKNATVVEYTVTSYRVPKGEENNVKVTLSDGKEKIIYAQGQGSYQGFGAYMDGFADASTDNYLIRFNPNGTGRWNTHKGYTKPANATDRGGISWQGSAVALVNNIPRGDTHVLEYVNEPYLEKSEADRTGYYFNKEYKIKHIIEPHSSRCFTYINGILVEAGNTADAAINGQYSGYGWNETITRYLGFHAKLGTNLKLDDIKVSEYVPGLTISEIMTNGTYKADGSIGKYQWVEITNPGDAPVNVYDYAIHLWNMANGHQYIGNMVDTYQKGSGSTIGYFTPGAKTLANGDIFNSPSYAEGVLAAGESAIVLLPQTKIAGGGTGIVTDAAFRSYLEGLGMAKDKNVKLFVANPENEYSTGTKINNEFYLAHLDAQESSTIGIVKVINESAEGYDPIAPAIGQPTDHINAFAECTVVITGKQGGGTNWYTRELYEYNASGAKVQSDANGDGFLGFYPAASLKGDTPWRTTGDKSFEISYSGWYKEDAPYSNLQWGFQKYVPTDARKNAAGTNVYTTPGYVPADCARVVSISIFNVDNKDEDRKDPDEFHGFAAFRDATVTLKTPQKGGYDVQVWVDGVLVMEDVDTATTTYTFTAAQMKNATPHTIELIYNRVGSYFIGYQKSEVVDGAYTLRLLAGVNATKKDDKLPTFEYDSFGFDITMTYDDGGQVSQHIQYDVGYVYTAVTVGGETVTAEELGFDYLYAVHINNIDVSFDPMTVDAIATYTVGDVVNQAREGAIRTTITAAQ